MVMEREARVAGHMILLALTADETLHTHVTGGKARTSVLLWET